jgi:hypothetical protein
MTDAIPKDSPLYNSAADAACALAGFSARATYAKGYEDGIAAKERADAAILREALEADIPRVREDKVARDAAIRARDEVGLQLVAAQAVIARMQPVVDAARKLPRLRLFQGDYDTALQDALRALDTVPGELAPLIGKDGKPDTAMDAWRPIDTEDPAAGLLAASGIDAKGVG